MLATCRGASLLAHYSATQTRPWYNEASACFILAVPVRLGLGDGTTEYCPQISANASVGLEVLFGESAISPFLVYEVIFFTLLPS